MGFPPPRLALALVPPLLASGPLPDPPGSWSASGPAPHNILLIVADDVGVDRIGAYAEHPDPGRTPAIDRLAEEGLLFRNAWATPTCSSSRATLLTGRFGFRTGVGNALTGNPLQPQVGLSIDEFTLADALGEAGYASYALGKWHLVEPTGSSLHPLLCGFDVHAGSLHNLAGVGTSSAGDYFHWPKSVQGVPTTVTKYATTDTADDAVQALGTLSEPWFLWVAFNAAHKPFHAPPAELHDFALSGPPGESPVPHFKAAVQALDAEIGRMLSALDPAVRARTTVVFIGDNGTPVDAIDAPFVPSHGKGSLYEGGVRVPLIVSGPAVAQPGSESQALVNSTDLFATVLELTGAGPSSAEDSISFANTLAQPHAASARRYLYAERFKPNGPPPWAFRRQAVRDGRYKLLRREPEGIEELYDLRADPFEQTNLLGDRPLEPELAAIHARLAGALERLGS